MRKISAIMAIPAICMLWRMVCGSGFHCCCCRPDLTAQGYCDQIYAFTSICYEAILLEEMELPEWRYGKYVAALRRYRDLYQARQDMWEGTVDGLLKSLATYPAK